LRVLSFTETVTSALSAQLVYENRLGISSQKLLGGAVDWNTDVVCKLIGSEYRISVTPMDALVITNRIMRKENYMIALFNRGLLDLRMPPIFDFITDTCYCPSLEVSCKIIADKCVLNSALPAVEPLLLYTELYVQSQV
jgi:Autophagy protein ATG9